MSRKSIAEYVAEKRRVYAKSGSAKRTRMIDEVCETLGYTRKYVIKLLTGNIRYRERKGRGKTYGDSVLANARKLWEAVGCPCTTYFVAELPRIVHEYEACIALIKPKEDKESILAMSASTLDRAFKGLPRIKPFAVKSNRRSGLNRPILDAIECKSGEEIMACDVRPGDTQIDTVAHCGGDMRGNFFWTLTQTDRNTQWTEITPTWNKGMHNTVEALKRLERRFPFPITSEHEDNGPEFINYAMAEMQGRRKDISISRSRFYRKNDNAHVEQKNGSVVRELFGELRLDCQDLEADLMRLEAEWSDYCNFFRPTKMIVAKTKKPDGKGFVRRYQTGGPRTPYQRVLESGILDEAATKALKERYEKLNGIQLYQQAVRRMKRILRRQECWRDQQRQTQKLILEARLADSALRAAPGILLAARLLISRAGAPQGPVSPTYQQAGANQMKRENHRSFLLLLFLSATVSVEFRYGAVVAFRFADVSVRPPLGNKAMPEDSERPRQLRERAHYGLICGPQRLSTILRSGNDVQPGLERFRHLKRGTTVPIPER